MKHLLDTHTLLWWLDNSSRLSQSAREVIANPDNRIFVSAASAWEISIKKALGKLEAPANLEQAIVESGFEILVITVEAGTKAGELPMHHRDPFDRMLIAQALIDDLTIITNDDKFEQYDVNLQPA